MTTVTTLDALYAGALQFKQSKAGYRFGLDSVLLGSFAKAGFDRTLDLGTGSGVIALMLLHENKTERVCGLEVQEGLLKLARTNVSLNGYAANCELVQGDLRHAATLSALGRFDRVVMNPPYFAAKAGRLPPDEEKAIAKHKLLGGLEEWLLAASRVLDHRGIVEIVYPSERLPDVFIRCKEHDLQPIELTVVHTRAKAPAELVLVRAQKGSRSGLAITQPWYVFSPSGKPNPRFSALRE